MPIQVSSPSARRSRYAGTQLFAGAVRRRDDGGLDARRTDSPDPHTHERAARMGRPFVKAFFLLDRPRPVLFLTLSKRERGAESPGPSRPPRRGRSPPETSRPSQPSWAIFRPMRVPMTEAIISPRVQPELSPRQWRPWRLVLKSVSIFTRLE